MKTVLALATATVLFAFGNADATEISPGKMQSLILPEMSQSQSWLNTVQYRRCRYWRRECAFRWGWGGWRYRRCLFRHGC